MDDNNQHSSDPLQQMLFERLEHAEKIKHTDRLIDRISKPTMAIVALVIMICAWFSAFHMAAIATFLGFR